MSLLFLNIDLFRELDSITLDTKAKTAEWDDILSSSQCLQVELWWPGWIWKPVDPCCVVELSVPVEGYNHAIHHIFDGEATAGWRAT